MDLTWFWLNEYVIEFSIQYYSQKIVLQKIDLVTLLGSYPWNWFQVLLSLVFLRLPPLLTTWHFLESDWNVINITLFILQINPVVPVDSRIYSAIVRRLPEDWVFRLIIIYVSPKFLRISLRLFLICWCTQDLVGSPTSDSRSTPTRESRTPKETTPVPEVAPRTDAQNLENLVLISPNEEVIKFVYPNTTICFWALSYFGLVLVFLRSVDYSSGVCHFFLVFIALKL